MTGEILKSLLIASLAGSCTAAVITALKPVTKRIFGYSWHYYIWLTVLAAMLLPVRFTLPQKANTMPAPEVRTVQHAQPEQAENVIPPVQTAPKTDILQTGTRFAERMTGGRAGILAYSWLAGAIILLLVNLIGYIRLIRKIRKNSVVVSCPEIADFTKRKIDVRVWENMSSPFMTGIFKPALILPAKELTEEQLHNILLHEMTHFKRRDILYKLLVVLAKCVHWFNPVIWYVSKQINTECEISCDMAVTLEMSGDEEKSYIGTILSLLPSERSISLTTQMSGGKKVLKKRFEMIKNKRRTGKFMSVLSAVTAAAMLTSTVFASGVLSGFAGRTVRVTNGGKTVELKNKPFIENDTVYLPLREMLNAEGISDISYFNGYVEFLIYSEEPIEYRSLKYDFWINRVQIGSVYVYIAGHSHGSTENDEISEAPVLKDGVTYVPYDLFDKLKKSGQGVFEDMSVYDENGNPINNTVVGTVITDRNNKIVFKSDDMKNPEDTVSAFFAAFSRKEFDIMRNFCTPDCISKFFGAGYVFGMSEASLSEVTIDFTEYLKSSNDFNIFVTVNMTPHEISAFDPGETSASFYVMLQRQPDGRYLIDKFANGI
ncbi:MAG: M56 family metallopeptidase [Oscillospiraceae bacterium]|nr:M56 family metallopeptidase [Oscillospiraceae bacterium]